MNRFISKVVGEKGQWRQYKARVRELPAKHRAAVEAMERYLMSSGMVDDGTAVYGSLVERFERGASEGMPVGKIVGDDPLEFIQALVRDHPTSQWITRERRRLTDAIETIVRDEEKR